MPADPAAIGLWQTIERIASDAAVLSRPVRATVVDEVDGMVRLRWPGDGDPDTGIDDPEDAPERYPRAAGPPFPAGTEVLAQRTPGGSYVITAAVQRGAGNPAGAIEGTGGLPGAPVLDVLALIVPSLRWQGTVRTMTTKQLTLARMMVRQFPGLLHVASGGRVGVRVRLVVQEGTWDLDAAIAAGRAEVATFGTTGRWLTDEGAAPLWDAYRGRTYDSRFLFLGTGQMDSTVNELTRRDDPYTFVNVEDTWYDADRAAGRVADLMVHGLTRQVEELLRDRGADALPLDGWAANGYARHAVRGLVDWYRYWWGDADISDLIDDDRLPDVDPRAASVPFAYVDPDDAWGTLAIQADVAGGGGGPGTRDYPITFVAATAPTGARTGDFWYQTTATRPPTDDPHASLIVSSTAPVGPSLGHLWYQP